MVAVGVGLAPEGYAKTPAAQAGLERMRAYLTAHPPQHTHQRLVLLWADHCAGGMLTDDPAIRRGIDWIKTRQRQSG